MAFGVPCCDGIQWKTFLCWGHVIIKFSESEILSLLAESKVKNNFLSKAIKIKHLNY